MSQNDETAKTQSDEAGSTVLSGTILESQLAQIRPDLRGKVSGKFLRLTRSDDDLPVFVRVSDIGAFHDLFEKPVMNIGFPGVFKAGWICGRSFGFTVKERAEDVQALIGMVEGGPSADALSQVLVSIFVAAGMNTAQAAALLAEDRAGDAVQAITELCERLIRAEAERPHVEALHENLTLLLIRILGHWTPETREGLVDLHTLNAALPRACDYVSRLRAQLAEQQQTIKTLEESFLRHRSDQDKLTSACEKIFEALSFTDADYAREGVDYRTEQAGLVSEQERQIEVLKQRLSVYEGQS